MVSNGCLTPCIPGWEQRAAGAPHVLGVLVGEGIGPEVVDAALVVLDAVASGSGLRLEVRHGGQVAAEEARRLTAGAAEFCASVFAAGGTLLCGPTGGRSVYDLRQRFDLYCKLVPIRPSPALADAAIVCPDRLAGVDMLIVRENVGGLYFGDYGRREGGRVAYQHLSYDAEAHARRQGRRDPRGERVVEGAGGGGRRRSGRRD
jgi:3-isopropylmalate dehydrogenase